jgi:hypothetical protein
MCRSFRELPPNYHVRLTVLVPVADRELSAWLSKFFRRLRYRTRCEYLAVNEWADGRRHTHILLRTDQCLPAGLVRELWGRVCPLPFTHQCARVRSPPAMARYVVKHIRDDSRKELPPPTFTGRLWTYSRGFFSKAVRELWKEQVAEWYGPRATQTSKARGTEDKEKR